MASTTGELMQKIAILFDSFKRKPSLTVNFDVVFRSKSSFSRLSK